MKKIVFFVFSLLSLVTCGKRESVFVVGRQVIASGPEIEKTLSPTAVFSGPSFLGAIGVMYAADSMVLVATWKTGYAYRVVNLTNNHAVDLLATGRGPNEVVAGAFSGVRKEGDRRLLDVTALNEGYLMSIDLDASVQDGNVVVVDKEEILPEAWLSFFVKENVLSNVIADADTYSFKLYSRGDHLILRTEQIFGDEPYLIQFQPEFESARYVKPDRTRLCLMMSRFDEINVLDLVGADHLSISLPKKVKEDATILNELLAEQTLTSDRFYGGGYVTDDAIYALYLGYDERETEYVIPSIRVFSWDGQLKAIYHLDHPVTSIAVSEDGETLYGLTDEEVLYRYDLTQ